MPVKSSFLENQLAGLSTWWQNQLVRIRNLQPPTGPNFESYPPVSNCPTVAQPMSDVLFASGPQDLSRLKKYIAVDSNRIENVLNMEQGPTMTYVDPSFATQIVNSDKTLGQNNFALSLLKANAECLDEAFTAATPQKDMTVDLVLKTHAKIVETALLTLAVDANGKRRDALIPSGRFKRYANTTNIPGFRILQYCQLANVAGELDKLLKELMVAMTGSADRLTVAAWFHYNLSLIHTFMCMPLLVTINDKSWYFSALQQTTPGKYEPLRDFFDSMKRQSHLVVISRTPSSAPTSAIQRGLEALWKEVREAAEFQSERDLTSEDHVDFRVPFLGWWIRFERFLIGLIHGCSYLYKFRSSSPLQVHFI